MSDEPLPVQVCLISESGGWIEKSGDGVLTVCGPKSVSGVVDDVSLRGEELGDLVAWFEEHGIGLRDLSTVTRCGVCGLLLDKRLPRRAGWTCNPLRCW